MPLLFTSLLATGAGFATPGEPDPDAGFAWTGNLLYHFRATTGVFADPAGATLAGNGDPVARWANQGAREDALQPSVPNRAIFHTGGLNGRPYLACSAASQKFFEDLAFTQPAGFTAVDPYTVFVVTDAVVPASIPALLGSTASNGGKTGFYLRPNAGQQIHFFKPAIRVGDVANPQIVMATVGRNAAGTTSTPAVRFWLRQNGITLWSAAQETTNAVSTAIAATQFLRNTGTTPAGYFDGHLYEFLLYQGTLDNPTTFAIEAFLAEKYGIALA